MLCFSSISWQLASGRRLFARLMLVLVLLLTLSDTLCGTETAVIVGTTPCCQFEISAKFVFFSSLVENPRDAACCLLQVTLADTFHARHVLKQLLFSMETLDPCPGAGRGGARVKPSECSQTR